jgi:colanic acid/amylovoran biosynthesis glycosyltransferase
VSDFWRTRLIELGCPPDQIAVHHMGIELSKFPLPKRRGARGDDTVRLLSVARLVEKKGVEYAIRAVARLREKTERRIEYRVLGDGPLRRELEELVRELDVGDSVRLMGEMDQRGVREAMLHSDIFVAPSVVAEDGDMEGVPVSIMEAMASRLPVVSTLHSGIPELVHDGISGLLVPERDSAGLARALARLTDDAGLRRRMGIAGRQVVEHDYDLDGLNDRLVGLLASMEDARPHPRVVRLAG